MHWLDTLTGIFGSQDAIAKIVEVKQQTVQQWRHGVPHKHCNKLLVAAKAKGRRLTIKQMRAMK